MERQEGGCFTLASRAAPIQSSALSSILLPVSGELAVRLKLHTVSCTALHKYGPDRRPQKRLRSGQQELEKQAGLGEGSCKAELADGDVGRATGFEHSDADQAEGNHVHEEFLVKGGGRLTMPGDGTQGMLELAVESLDVPSQVIEVGQF